jgi:hypothetical protein
MTRKRFDNNRLMDVIQINGKKAHECTPDECELIEEFYYRLTELEAIAERLRCPRPITLGKPDHRVSVFKIGKWRTDGYGDQATFVSVTVFGLAVLC